MVKCSYLHTPFCKMNIHFQYTIRLKGLFHLYTDFRFWIKGLYQGMNIIFIASYIYLYFNLI